MYAVYPFSVFYFLLFFFHDTATTEIYTLSLHDALPIYTVVASSSARAVCVMNRPMATANAPANRHIFMSLQRTDRKSTRLNSSHTVISYAVFCLKKKKKKIKTNLTNQQMNKNNVQYESE